MFFTQTPTPHPPPLLPLFPRAGMTTETLVSRTFVTAQSYCKHKRSDTFLLAQTHTHVINVPERHDVETQESPDVAPVQGSLVKVSSQTFIPRRKRGLQVSRKRA